MASRELEFSHSNIMGNVEACHTKRQFYLLIEWHVCDGTPQMGMITDQDYSIAMDPTQSIIQSSLMDLCHWYD